MLPPVHQSLLRYASVFGSHVDGLLLQNAFPEIKPEAMCEQLRRIGWLQSATVRNALSGVFVWRHDLYRESIYNSIEPNVRRQLHAEIAQQLEIFPETPPDVLADRYEAVGNPEKAAHYACLATAICHKQRRHLRVQRYAEMALSHPERLSQEQHVKIRYQYAYALRQTMHSSEAIPYLEQAFSLARTNNQRSLITMELAQCNTEHERIIALREKGLSLMDESTETSVIIAICRELAGPDRPLNPDVVRQVLRLTQKRKDHKAETLAFRLLALAQATAGNLVDAQSTIQHALQLAEALEDNGLLAEIEFGVAKILWERARSLEALNHLHRALHLGEQMEDKDNYYSWHFLLGQIYHGLEQYEAMTEAFEKVLERKEVFGEASQGLKEIFAFLVQGYAYRGDWGKAYHYFWQIVDNMASRPVDHIYLYSVEDAIGALCHGDKTNRRWMWEGIPQTMAHAQELIRHLYEHGITAEDNFERLMKGIHPILAAGYVEYGVKRSHEEGVTMMRLFAHQVWILDEHVEFWAYLSGTLDYDALEAIFEDALARVEREEPILLNEKHNRPEFFVSAHPEKLILKWLRACLRERYETDDAGKHLRQMGMIPEPCWLITGTFEEHVPAEVEQMILNIVFNRGKRDQMTLENRKASESDNLQSSTFNLQLDWRHVSQISLP